MFWNKKKQEPRIIETEVEVDVGITTIEIVFEDGTKQISKMYGWAYGDKTEVRHRTSMMAATDLLFNSANNGKQAFVDSGANPTNVKVGILKEAYILETVSHKVKVTIKKKVYET